MNTQIRLRAGVFLLLMLGLLYVGAWLLLVPNNPVNQLFEAPVSQFNARVIAGPYPTESDLLQLRQSGIDTVVSLLDARIPYEGILLQRERQAAQRYGLKFRNFPMASFLGQHGGNEYAAQAQAAANLVAHSQAHIYLHCYLGVHRVESVRALLRNDTVATAEYLPALNDPGSREIRAERLSMRFDAGDFAGALRWYRQIDHPGPGSRHLAAWSLYRTGAIDAAQQLFSALAASAPDIWDSHNGLGLCALRKEQLERAQAEFDAVLQDHPKDPQAMLGLALVAAHRQQFADALAQLDQVLVLAPDNQEALQLRHQYQQQIGH